MLRAKGWICGIGLAMAGGVHGDEDAFMKGRRFLAGDYSGAKVCIVEADGKISWSHAAPSCNDVWILGEERVLFTTGKGVKEVDIKTNAILFEYASSSEIYATQRLPNGNTFVGECSSAKLLEVAPDGRRIVRSLALIPPEKAGGKALPGGHGFMRNARVLKNGNYLVSHYAGKGASEYAPDGRIVWSVKTPTGIHSVIRLDNGNTLVAGSDGGPVGLYEYDPRGERVWSLTNDDLEGKPLKFLTGFQVLPNGHFLLSNWVGHGQFGKAPHILEVTRDKKVVWTFNDHVNFKTVASVQVFPKEGEKLEIVNVH